MEDLGMRRRRDRFNMVLEGTLPLTQQDVLVLFITVTGTKNRRPVQESYVRKIHHGTVMGRQDSAIQSASAAALCALVDLLREGKLPAKGYVRQEDVTLSDFLDNRFGECFR
jgi:saccharopine dehydrogenase-like NADP-dependent oxidoreductase